MTNYSNLAIFIKTYEFMKSLYHVVGQFRKEYKYSLGSELERIMWCMLDKIIKANSIDNADKSRCIDEISELFDAFKIRFRFSYEIGLVPEKKFITLQKDMQEIGKMIGGWKKWAKEK